MNEPIVAVRNLAKDYDGGLVQALRGISFDVFPGELVSVTGPSGCGKSTLLSLIGLLDRPTRGQILFKGKDLARMGDSYGYRAQSVGFVFQFHHLIPAMTLAENVASGMVALKIPRAERRARALELLKQMGLGHRAQSLPSKVSGGERQRAAVARALANRPTIVLADEPTGNLDSMSGIRVMDLFMSHAREMGVTVLLTTHNPEIAAWTDRTIEMRDGRITGMISRRRPRLEEEPDAEGPASKSTPTGQAPSFGS